MFLVFDGGRLSSGGITTSIRCTFVIPSLGVCASPSMYSARGGLPRSAAETARWPDCYGSRIRVSGPDEVPARGAVADQHLGVRSTDQRWRKHDGNWNR